MGANALESTGHFFVRSIQIPPYPPDLQRASFEVRTYLGNACKSSGIWTAWACIIEFKLRTYINRESSILTDSVQTPFDSVENAHQYVRLLAEAIAEAKTEIAADLDVAARNTLERRVQAFQIVQFKLDKLERHLQTS